MGRRRRARRKVVLLARILINFWVFAKATLGSFPWKEGKHELLLFIAKLEKEKNIPGGERGARRICETFFLNEFKILDRKLFASSHPLPPVRYSWKESKSNKTKVFTTRKKVFHHFSLNFNYAGCRLKAEIVFPLSTLHSLTTFERKTWTIFNYFSRLLHPFLAWEAF